MAIRLAVPAAMGHPGRRRRPPLPILLRPTGQRRRHLHHARQLPAAAQTVRQRRWSRGHRCQVSQPQTRAGGHRQGRRAPPIPLPRPSRPMRAPQSHHQARRPPPAGAGATTHRPQAPAGGRRHQGRPTPLPPPDRDRRRCQQRQRRRTPPPRRERRLAPLPPPHVHQGGRPRQVGRPMGRQGPRRGWQRKPTNGPPRRGRRRRPRPPQRRYQPPPRLPPRRHAASRGPQLSRLPGRYRRHWRRHRLAPSLDCTLARGGGGRKGRGCRRHRRRLACQPRAGFPVTRRSQAALSHPLAVATSTQPSVNPGRLLVPPADPGRSRAHGATGPQPPATQRLRQPPAPPTFPTQATVVTPTNRPTSASPAVARTTKPPPSPARPPSSPPSRHVLATSR